MPQGNATPFHHQERLSNGASCLQMVNNGCRGHTVHLVYKFAKKQISLISFLIIKLFMVSLLLLLAYSEILQSVEVHRRERGRDRNRILKENMHPMQASRIWTLVNKAAIGSVVLFLRNGYVQSWLCKHNMSTNIAYMTSSFISQYSSSGKGGLYEQILIYHVAQIYLPWFQKISTACRYGGWNTQILSKSRYPNKILHK